MLPVLSYRLVVVTSLLLIIGLTDSHVHAATTARSNILIVGDSLSAAYGIRLENSWVSLLQQRLAERNISKTVVNASISGDTTTSGVDRLPTLLEKYVPGIVIIELGGNDGLRGLRLPLIRENLTEMVVASQNVGARVLLIGMRLPPNYGPVYVTDFNNIYTQVSSAYGTKLVPFMLDGVATWEGMMQSDGIHPNEDAQAVILDNVWQALSEML